MQNKAEAQPAWLQLAAGAAAGSWGCSLGLAELGNKQDKQDQRDKQDVQARSAR